MIRVLVVDDHPSVRLGLVHVLQGEPGLMPVAAVRDATAALEDARRTTADVALVDYDLGGPDDGLMLALRLRFFDPAPRVVIYSGYEEEALAVGAHLAGVHAVLGKGAPLDRVFDAVKLAARGERRLPELPADHLASLRAQVSDKQGALLDMSLAGHSIEHMASSLSGGDLAETLGSLGELLRRSGPAARGGDSPATAQPA